MNYYSKRSKFLSSTLYEECGRLILGAQRPIVERDRLSDLLVAAVALESLYLGHGSAALHAALRALEDGLHPAEGPQVPEDPVGRGLGEP